MHKHTAGLRVYLLPTACCCNVCRYVGDWGRTGVVLPKTRQTGQGPNEGEGGEGKTQVTESRWEGWCLSACMQNRNTVTLCEVATVGVSVWGINHEKFTSVWERIHLGWVLGIDGFNFLFANQISSALFCFPASVSVIRQSQRVCKCGCDQMHMNLYWERLCMRTRLSSPLDLAEQNVSSRSRHDASISQGKKKKNTSDIIHRHRR